MLRGQNRLGWAGAVPSTPGSPPIPARRPRRSGLSVRIVRSSISCAVGRNSTLARTSPTRSGNIGRPLGMKGFYATPVPRSFSRPVDSGPAALIWRRMGTATSATSSDRTSITNMSTTTRSPTSWHAGTSGARSMWRRCCASAGPSAGQTFRAASAWMTLS